MFARMKTHSASRALSKITFAGEADVCPREFMRDLSEQLDKLGLRDRDPVP